MTLRIAFLFLLFTAVGCSNMKPEDFAENTPRLAIEEYFLGHTRAWGLFEDRFGTVRRQFTVDIHGRMEDGTLVLEEDFLYSDGERDRRVWRITKTGDNTYLGTADDVVGEATGRAFGNVLNWRYAIDLAVGDNTWRVDFNDWMFLQPDDVLINRAHVTKWGLEIGQVTLVFTKASANAANLNSRRMRAAG